MTDKTVKGKGEEVVTSTPERLTWRSCVEARAQLRSAGISVVACGGGEYRVAFSGVGNEDSAYYTNDLADALATGFDMLGVL